MVERAKRIIEVHGTNEAVLRTECVVDCIAANPNSSKGSIKFAELLLDAVRAECARLNGSH